MTDEREENGHMPARGQFRPLEDRIWEKVRKDVASGCWVWTGSLVNAGYGVIGVAEMPGHAMATRRAHRVVYQLLRGPVSPDLTLDHLCHNRACVNPDHLEPVPSGVNVLRGDGLPAQNARKTHCKRGHPLTPENIISLKNSHRRRCRACEAMWRQASQPRRTPRTRCPHGHEYTPENIVMDGSQRRCRVCRLQDQQDFARRRAEREGRTFVPGKGGHNAIKTHCTHGHEYTPENTGHFRTGGRFCRTCQNVANRHSYAKKRAATV